MKISSLRKLLVLAIGTIAFQNTAWSQCLVYSFTQKYSHAGYSSHSGVNTGYYLIGPKQITQDSLTRYPYIIFYTYSYKQTGKGFSYFEDYPIDGNPSSGGLLIGLVKQGNALKILASTKSAGQGLYDWNPFDAGTLSGAASFKAGYGYIASTLSATESSWGPNHRYYQDNYPDIGDSTSTDPVNVYKSTFSVTCSLNVKLTATVANKTFDQARDLIIQQLKTAGYQDNSTPQ
jgi:hypothetical protein